MGLKSVSQRKRLPIKRYFRFKVGRWGLTKGLQVDSRESRIVARGGLIYDCG